jgi:hypothetical protein
MNIGNYHQREAINLSQLSYLDNMACKRDVKEENKIGSEVPKGRGDFGDLRIYGWITVKWILKM